MERSSDDTTGTRRWLAVGTSNASDPHAAGSAAAADALRGSDPRLLLVFCSTRYDPAAVLAGIRATAPDVPLAGCSACAQIGTSGPDGGSVVVVAFGGPGFQVSTATSTGAGTTPREAGAAVADCTAAVQDSPYVTLLLLTDGTAPDQEDILRGAYDVVGASIPLVGGAASADASRRTFHLHGDEVLTDAVVGVAIGSDAPFGVGVRHGWRKVGEPMIVTSSTKGLVYTLDDKPALEMYLDRLGAPDGLREDPVAFDKYSHTRPIGVRRRTGEEVRNVSSTAYLADGWLGCSGDIPEGGVIWPMEGDTDSVLEAAEDACRDAVDALDGHPPVGLLAFDCVSRTGLLGTDGTRTEVDRMREQVGALPLAGFYTWGEIARTRGINGYHHQTLVVLAVG